MIECVVECDDCGVVISDHVYCENCFDAKNSDIQALREDISALEEEIIELENKLSKLE